jgi:phosphogluconate dehydratase
MPELHKLTPPLSVLQDQGLRVALVTDGRMSGASGKVLAAIHVTPESLDGGALAKIRDGDVICIDSERGELSVRVSAADWLQRPTPPLPDLSHNAWGTGRELFAAARANASSAEFGATTFGWATPVAGATIRLD